MKPGKTDKSDPGNYRPIALLVQFLKIYEAVIFARISSFCEGRCSCGCSVSPRFHPDTGGFRPGRSTLENILSLQEIVWDSRHNKRRAELYVCFLDISKAFDSVNRNALYSRLWSIGIRGKMWRVVRRLLEGFEGRVRVGGVCTDEFDIARGVIQGSRLGPLLFNFFFMILSES